MPQSCARPEWLEASGRKDGRYLIGPLLGHGGMGDVFEAWDTLLGRTVALKILTHAEPAAMVRFMHEARLQAKLEHPNICRIYDVEAQNGVPRIAMQLVKGPTLEDATNDLELFDIVTIAAEVAETLGDAHRAGLIHRDVKPGNIILEPREEGGWRPIICDFGLALALNESTLTQPNALTGTPAYMAPEQVRGDRRHIGPATDVYGLGGTLYFLLVGRPPCVSTVTQEMLRVKKEQRFPSPRSLEPSIPPRLEAILLRCLAPDPAERYPRMEPLAADLWAFLGRASERPRWKRRGTWAAAAAVLALLAGLGGLGWRRGVVRARWEEASHRAALEASNLEQGLRSEVAQPLHDIRPALLRIRGAREAALRPENDGQGRFVAGTADFCLGDFAAAREGLEKAWAAGQTSPEAAYLLGVACARQWLAQAQEAALRGQAPAPALRTKARDWFLLARGLSQDREQYAKALLAFMDQDLTAGLAHARASLASNPWRWESAALGAQCLTALARASLVQGDAEAAARAYGEALAMADDGIHQAQSEGQLRHAALAAALGLAHLDRLQGRLRDAGLARLMTRAEEALRIDPDAPQAQADWLAVQCLHALHLRDLGRNPQPVLDQALVFFRVRTRDPRPPELQATHLVLTWLATRGDPDPAPSRAPNFLPAILDLKAGWPPRAVALQASLPDV